MPLQLGERDVALAAYEERPLHLLHLSARESVAALARAQAAGVAATAEVTPHHLCLTDEAVRTLDRSICSLRRHASEMLPILGDQATLSYARYMKSFEHEIPDFFETDVAKSKGSSSSGR